MYLPNSAWLMYGKELVLGAAKCIVHAILVRYINDATNAFAEGSVERSRCNDVCLFSFSFFLKAFCSIQVRALPRFRNC